MRRSGTCAALVLSLLATGCASVANPNPADPFERWNRGVQGFNDTLDDAVLKPVATTWRDVVPEWIRAGAGNFFGNLGDAWSAVNHFLQAKGEDGLNMTLRFVTNSTVGLFGLLDPASEMGLDRRSEDFGQTLGRWGVGPGPYLVLPLLGPSTVRDAAALPLDWMGTSTTMITDDPGKLWAATAVQVINGRANLLGATRLLDDIALDRYSFLRNAFLARRRNLVYDGDPPELPEPEEPAAAGAAAPPPAGASAPR